MQISRAAGNSVAVELRGPGDFKATKPGGDDDNYGAANSPTAYGSYLGVPLTVDSVIINLGVTPKVGAKAVRSSVTKESAAASPTSAIVA
ncbi:hypothetical protein PAAG_11086 [Paracoccidioides lutzii Pb01]|uniref:Uncharacterized protein n=1 Tax=Paracoccidioides lutzii (strain ATCC MYA-826 / Pb01) TaxID=502779 RepID=A0A0A2V7T4_PARBA|nr:hypothetical protein PAAG_11086 [Paracoccidioides lutzii Pb01]KGQ02135.1 hypothetical protein PAAG_11086 [Paracoccidioides lutzii Pb01]